MFAIQLIDQVHELFLISDVFQGDNIMGIQRYVPTVAAMMKEILSNQNHADNSVMAASRKQVTHLLGLDVVEEIVYNHEAPFTTTATNVLPYALVICGFLWQLLTFGNGGLLTVTPDYTAAEFAFGAEGVDVL